MDSSLPRQQASSSHSSHRHGQEGLPNYFQEAMNFGFRRDQERLNEDYQRRLRALQNPPHPPPTMNQMPQWPEIFLHCDYQNQTDENQYRYGLSSGKVYVWGQDDNQQLGQPKHAALEEGTKQSTYGPLLVNIQKQDKENDYEHPLDIIRVSAGGQHCMALTDEGVPYTW
jgi:hypothetical protein